MVRTAYLKSQCFHVNSIHFMFAAIKPLEGILDSYMHNIKLQEAAASYI